MSDQGSSKILIVEDESIVAMDIQRRLERLDYAVVGLDYVDFAMVSFGDAAHEKREVTLAHPASGEQFVFRNYAYLRCRGKKIAGRGDLAAFVIRDSGLETSASFRLNGQQASMLTMGWYVFGNADNQPVAWSGFLEQL